MSVGVLWIVSRMDTFKNKIDKTIGGSIYDHTFCKQSDN